MDMVDMDTVDTTEDDAGAASVALLKKKLFHLIYKLPRGLIEDGVIVLEATTADGVDVAVAIVTAVMDITVKA
jgi:hypothetical protein